MSRVRDLFRTCPSCGRRFHINLVDRRLVDERRNVEIVKQGRAGSTSTKNVYIVTVEADVPITVDVKDFQYTYRCKHCGHVWSETHTMESRA